MASLLGKFIKKKKTEEKPASSKDSVVKKKTANTTKTSKAPKAADSSKKSNKKSDGKEAGKAVSTTTTVKIDNREDMARILTHPRMTEKATLGIDRGVYVFNVAQNANKKQIKEAVKLVYNVSPVKVNVTKISKKKVRNARTGVRGTKAGGKKAYVYLKKGDSISLM